MNARGRYPWMLIVLFQEPQESIFLHGFRVMIIPVGDSLVEHVLENFVGKLDMRFPKILKRD